MHRVHQSDGERLPILDAFLCHVTGSPHVTQSDSVKKDKSDLVGCSQLEVGIGSSGVEMTIKRLFAKFPSLFD